MGPLEPSLPLYQTLIAGILEGVAVVDRNYTFVLANQSYADRLGLAAQEMPGRAVVDLFGPTYFEAVSKPLLDASFAGKTGNMEGWYDVPQQGQRYLLITTKPCPSNDGEIVGAFIYVQDATEEMLASSALAESEQAYRTLAERSPDLICRIDLDSRHLYVNQALARTLGLSPAEIVGKTNQDLGVPEDAQRTFDAIRAQVAKTKAEVSFEIRYPSPEGAARDLLMRIVPEFDSEGNVQSLLSTARDITERVQAEEALRQSEARLRSIYERTEDAIWAFDLRTGRLIYANPATERIYGRPVADFGADSRLWLKTVHPDDRPLMRRAYEMSAQGMIQEWTYRIVRPDGEIRWVNTRPWLVLNEEQKPVRIEGIARDITAAKQAEEREFELALEKERTNLLSTFITHASHEFRTPLSIIQLNANLISRSKTPQEQEQRVAQIKAQVAGVVHLVNMLQRITQLDSVGLADLTPVNVADLLRSVSAAQAERYARSLPVICHAPEEALTVRGDVSQLSEALSQVLDNACRFTPAEGTVSLHAGRQGDQVWLEVRDTGMGIPAAWLPHIFDTFWRQDEAHSTPGFGLGLPIAQRIVALHQGQINVYSQVGEGTTVRISLPGFG